MDIKKKRVQIFKNYLEIFLRLKKNMRVFPFKKTSLSPDGSYFSITRALSHRKEDPTF